MQPQIRHCIARHLIWDSTFPQYFIQILITDKNPQHIPIIGNGPVQSIISGIPFGFKKGWGDRENICACSTAVTELSRFMVLWSGSTPKLKCQCFCFKTSQKTGAQLKVSSDRLMELGIKHRVEIIHKVDQTSNLTYMSGYELYLLTECSECGGMGYLLRDPLSYPIITLQ